MKTLLKNASIVLDKYSLIDKGSLLLVDDRVQEVFIDNKEVACDKAYDLEGMTVYPGFIDIHVHGGYGEDFINGSKAVRKFSQNVVQDGTTAFLASLTVLSKPAEKATLQSLALHKEEGACCLGIHMEGPYLSTQYKALMDERYLKDPDCTELDAMLEQSNNSIRVMTIAPERKGMKEFIPYLVSKGVIPMIGHTATDWQTALQACTLGAKGFTHLYNAMSQHTHRDPGCVTGAFLSQGTYAEMICDGFHINPAVIKMTYNYLGPQRIILITDSMLGKGMPDGEYVFSGLHCQKKGIQVRVQETGRISGSAIGMIDAFRLVSKSVNPTKPQLCALTSGNAAELLADKSRGNLRNGARGDLVVLDKDLNVKYTFVGGQEKYHN